MYWNKPPLAQIAHAQIFNKSSREKTIATNVQMYQFIWNCSYLQSHFKKYIRKNSLVFKKTLFITWHKYVREIVKMYLERWLKHWNYTKIFRGVKGWILTIWVSIFRRPIDNGNDFSSLELTMNNNTRRKIGIFLNLNIQRMWVYWKREEKYYW